MTDEIWRSEDSESGRRRRGPLEAEMDAFDDSEFGGPLFGDTSETDVVASDTSQPSALGDPQDAPVFEPTTDDDWSASPSGGGERLRLDDDNAGPLQHWTEDATGEIPTISPTSAQPDPTDDLDVWSTFTSDAPVWKEGDAVDSPTGATNLTAPADPTGELSWEDAPAAPVASADGAVDASVLNTGGNDVVTPQPPREPARITIGTDPSGMPRRPVPQRRGAPAQRPPSAAGAAPGSKRNLPVAIGTGLVLAGVFFAASLWRPLGATLFVTVVLGLAAVEYFSKVTEKGYRPAVAAGVLACIVAPLVTYWVGEIGLPLVLALAFFAGAAGFVSSDSIEVGPMPNMAITMLGIVWIGVLGSFATLIIRYSNFFDGLNIGVETLILLACGVVANDVGAFFVGSAFGKTPLRKWISPNKSVEGLLGGTILTLLVMLLVGVRGMSDTWSDLGDLLMLGVVISIFAPLGDFTESMFKRNLDVKDFGSIVKGHGGVLDRFDGFLFTLPAVYYLLIVIEPWTELATA